MASDTPNTEHKKGLRPKRKQSPPFTDAQIAEAVERWVNGEFLKDIAPSYGVSPSQLQAYTKFARIGKTSTAKKPKLLSDAQIAEAAERWVKGETLKDIALSYGVSTERLWAYTKIARIGKSRKSLTDAQIAEAVECWVQGESLKDIASRYGISVALIRLYTRIGRARKKRISRPFSISEQQISAAMVQWELGVPTNAIAEEYGVSHKFLAEKLILCCAKRGWRIKEIVKSFRKSHSEIRGIILRNAPVQ